MPFYDYKCDTCGYTKQYLVGGPQKYPQPDKCDECGGVITKQFSCKNVSGDVVGGYEYEYGKKNWRKHHTQAQQAEILMGDRQPY